MISVSLPRARSTRVAIVGAVGFAGALAAAAQVAIPIPGTPVPFTLQPLVVLLAGFWLGPAVGAASMALYVAAGAIGLPVWSPIGVPGVGRLLGPTGGYLLAYPVAAFVTGWIAERSRTLAGRALAGLVGMAAIFIGGLAQLTLLTGSAASAMTIGAHPFLALDLVKAAIAALLAPPRGSRTAA